MATSEIGKRCTGFHGLDMILPEVQSESEFNIQAIDGTNSERPVNILLEPLMVRGISKVDALVNHSAHIKACW